MIEIPENLSDFELAAALTLNAGSLALNLRAEGLQEAQKTGIADIVTNADTSAEAYVTEQLRKHRPDDGVFGEEGASVSGTSGRTWVIDPVDGTYNFASRLSHWCSALALVEGAPEGEASVILGAVYQPEEDALWIGGVDHPTTRNGEVVQVHEVDLAHGSVATSVHGRELIDERLREPFEAIVAAAASIRVLGSGSCDLARVADGRLGCWTHVNTKPWDWYPGKALVSAAGGATAVIEYRDFHWHMAGSESIVADLKAILS